MAAPKKNPDHRQDNRASRSPALVPRNSLEAFEAPLPSEAWVVEIREAWADLWASDLQGVLDANALHIARRLFDMRNEQAYLMMLYREEPYVEGSTGQKKLNPAFTEAQKLETSIVALEDRLGLSPKAKANLGLVIGQAQLTVEELNKRARERVESQLNATNQESGSYEPFIRP